MNIQKLVFKMLVTLTYLVRVWALVLPISLAIIFMKEEGWRYGFTFIQSNFNVALFISFALIGASLVFDTDIVKDCETLAPLSSVPFNTIE